MWRVEALLKNNHREDTVLESVTGLAFARYPAKLFDDLVAYGHEFAVRVLDNKQYHLFDPMVSDRSCQLRAIWLACFWQFKKKADDLTDEDRFVFGLARFLSESAVRFYHEITGSASIKTKPITQENDVFHLSNARERQRFQGIAKALFARRVLQDLSRWFLLLTPEQQVLGRFECSPCDVYVEVLRQLVDPAHVAYSDIEVPVPHFFLGFIVLVSLSAYFSIPFVAILRRVCRGVDGLLSVDKVAVHNFFYDDHRKTFLETGETRTEDSGPAIIFSGHTYLTGSKQVDPDRMLETIDESERQATFADYVYGIMATHESLPRDGCDLRELEAVAPHVVRVVEEYRKFAQRTGVRSLETGSLIYGALCSDSLGSLQLSTSAYEITHIYNGSVSENFL